MEKGIYQPVDSYGSGLELGEGVQYPLRVSSDGNLLLESAARKGSIASIWYRVRDKFLGFSNRNMSIIDNILVFAPVVFMISLVIGISFYYFVDKWDLPTSIYYATQVLIGEMYGDPSESSATSKAFTILYFIWGNTLMAGVFGAFASSFVSSTLKREREKARLMQDACQTDPIIHSADSSISSNLCRLYTTFLNPALSPNLRLTILLSVATISWFLVGVVYGLIIEQWDIMDSLYFALTTMSCSGLAPSFVCTTEYSDTCRVDILRALFLCVYIIIGVPLYGYSVSQLAGVIVRRAIREEEIYVLTRPLNEDEYTLAKDICRHAKTSVMESPRTGKSADRNINLTEFIILELLRLKRFDEDDIEDITRLFYLMDETGRGQLETTRLRRNSFLTENLVETYRSDIDTKLPQFPCKVSEKGMIPSVSVSSPPVIELLSPRRPKSPATSFPLGSEMEDEHVGVESKEETEHHQYNSLVLATRLMQMKSKAIKAKEKRRGTVIIEGLSP